MHSEKKIINRMNFISFLIFLLNPVITIREVNFSIGLNMAATKNKGITPDINEATLTTVSDGTLKYAINETGMVTNNIK